jgi:hypothetical protein
MEIRRSAACCAATSYQAGALPEDRPGKDQGADGPGTPSLLIQWGQALQSPAPLERAWTAIIFTGVGP